MNEKYASSWLKITIAFLLLLCLMDMPDYFAAPVPFISVLRYR
jgi:hypothetical protein